jgi:hypothetical protein
VANQVCRNRTKPVKDLELPIHEGFQVGNSEQSDKRLPVTIQDIDVATKMWGKNIAKLKGKTTRSKTHPVARDYVKVPNELLKLHKEVFLKTDIFYREQDSFFIDT